MGIEEAVEWEPVGPEIIEGERMHEQWGEK